MFEALDDVLSRLSLAATLLIPYEESGLLNLLYEQAVVQSKEFKPEGIEVCALLTPALAGQLAKYIVKGKEPIE
jgi:50S ribosomal subunit-associated GTPase HflX